MRQADPRDENTRIHYQFSLSWHYKFFIWPLILGSVTWIVLRGDWSGLGKYGVYAGCLYLWFYTLTISYRVEIVDGTITFFRLIGRKIIETKDVTGVEDSLFSLKVRYAGDQIRVTNLLQNFSVLSALLRSSQRAPENELKESVVPCSKTEAPQPGVLGIDHFQQLPKGNIRRNNNFYGWASTAVMFMFMGSMFVKDGRVIYHGKIAFEGQPAEVFGIAVIFFGIYFLYYLFFIAKTEELKLGEFHGLDDFDDIIEGYRTKFNIEHTVTVAGNSCISIFYYRLEIRFKKELNLGLDIKQRDRFEHLLWLIGITRLFDVHTANRHFDSHYRVKCQSRELFSTVFNFRVIEMLEAFDGSYPPIRKKNGILHITDAGFRYVEGPYGEGQRLFDPHRGKIEDLFRELIEIMREIEANANQ